MRVADIHGGHCNPVSIMTKVRAEWSGFDSWVQEGGEMYSSFLPLSDRLVDSPNLLSSGVGMLHRELSGRGLTITDVKNNWCLTGIPPYILMAWAWGLIKHTENFVLGTSVLSYSHADTPAEQN